MAKTLVSRLSLLLLSTGMLALTACGGGGGGGSGTGTVPIPQPSATNPPPTATPAPPGASSVTINTYAGATNGTPGQFSPAEGDTNTGGQGQPVDGVTCDTAMSDNYHIHVYLGVFVNGTQVALPPGTGMYNPQPPDSTGFVNFASCFYVLHTHDASGIVHIEDPDVQNLPITQSMYSLKTYLDTWGITADANHFGPFQGPVRVFTSGQQDRSGSANDTVSATTLTYFGSDPTNIPLFSHEVVFVEIGPTYPASLPNVHFYINQ